MIHQKLNCGNMNPEGQEMGGLWDTIVSKINTPETKAKFQAEIDKQKQAGINTAIAQASNVAGKILTKSGATNKSALEAISKVTGAVTEGAQQSLWETHKTKIYIGAGVLALGIGALIWKKYKK